jgi:hypothetical protein
LPGHAKRGAKRADMIDKSRCSPISKRQREEEFSASNMIAPVSDPFQHDIPDFAHPGYAYGLGKVIYTTFCRDRIV